MAETWDQGQKVSNLEPVRSWALIVEMMRREAIQSESDVRNKVQECLQIKMACVCGELGVQLELSVEFSDVL